MDKAMEIRVNKAWEITDVKAQKKKKLPKLTGTSLKKKKKKNLFMYETPHTEISRK